jgi:hypothetical protein
MTRDQALAVLLSDRNPPDREQRAALFADMIACFHAFNIRIVGAIKNALVIQNEAWPYGDMWMLSDNGGELNVTRINSAELTRSEPYTWDGIVLDGATMAYRVRCVLDGDPVDYNLRHDADVLDICKEMATGT